jgi:hypothetical protein
MSAKMNGVSSGLGDRLGNYLMYATIGEIKNVDVYTTWIYEEKSYGQRGTQYPDDIFEYISFPKRLKFVSSEELNKLNLPGLGYKWIYHGFDYIPETLYKSMSNENAMNYTFEEFIEIYRKVCKELFYKKELPFKINEDTGIIHIRRGDKGNNVSHTDKILNLVNKYNNDVHGWIITSDEKISEEISKNILNLISVNWSTDEKIKVLEEFFVYTQCSIIIQSVNFQKNHPSTWSGWAGYSYVALQLGLSNSNKKLPILISCNNDDENTRMTYANKFAERKLFNIFMYNDIIQ